MMSGRDFSLLAEHLARTKPNKEDSIAAWQQYADCVNAVAKACVESNLARFNKRRFIKVCFSGEQHGKDSNPKNIKYSPRIITV